MKKILFDAHAHINDESLKQVDRDKLASEIENSQVAYVVDAGSNLATSAQSIKNSQKYPWCYAIVGVHPHDSKELEKFSETDALSKIRALASQPKVCGIGEIGLDFHYDFSERDIQRKWFRKQIQLANDMKLPIVIHSREADQETMDILKEEGAFSKERQSAFPKRLNYNGKPVSDSRVLIHCYSGSLEMAEQYVNLGATISICGPVTFKNNRKTVEVATHIPIEFLTIETDSPYLAPVPHRGKKNKPPYVEHIARRIAILKGMEYEEVAEITCNNAKNFYNIK